MGWKTNSRMSTVRTTRTYFRRSQLCWRSVQAHPTKRCSPEKPQRNPGWAPDCAQACSGYERGDIQKLPTVLTPSAVTTELFAPGSQLFTRLGSLSLRMMHFHSTVCCAGRLMAPFQVG
ncbi:hypothetical protein SAMN05216186_1364 [Pseudomonas indica]|uniref:Uncharacterized protein n=1 Tax=Pseudomonas indica TaxID=137658 RepID=A0A1G9P353_9PSED|nr:hypothetical protein SAMN05216186_1364 [Pseudomonas indica]